MLGENLYMQKFHIVANKLRIKNFMQLNIFPPLTEGDLLLMLYGISYF